MKVKVSQLGEVDRMGDACCQRAMEVKIVYERPSGRLYMVGKNGWPAKRLKQEHTEHGEH